MGRFSILYKKAAGFVWWPDRFEVYRFLADQGFEMASPSPVDIREAEAECGAVGLVPTAFFVHKDGRSAWVVEVADEPIRH